MKEGGNVTVLAQLHIWHKSHTLPGSSICTVACLLCYCLVAYLAQVTHLAGKFHLHAPCREVPSARTLPGSSICTVACLLRRCLIPCL